MVVSFFQSNTRSQICGQPGSAPPSGPRRPRQAGIRQILRHPGDASRPQRLAHEIRRHIISRLLSRLYSVFVPPRRIIPVNHRIHQRPRLGNRARHPERSGHPCPGGSIRRLPVAGVGIGVVVVLIGNRHRRQGLRAVPVHQVLHHHRHHLAPRLARIALRRLTDHQAPPLPHVILDRPIAPLIRWLGRVRRRPIEPEQLIHRLISPHILGQFRRPHADHDHVFHRADGALVILPHRLARIEHRHHQPIAPHDVAVISAGIIVQIRDGAGHRKLGDLPALLVADEDVQLLLKLAQRPALGRIHQPAGRRLRNEVHPEALLLRIPLIRAGERNGLGEFRRIPVQILLLHADLIGPGLLRQQPHDHRRPAVGPIQRAEPDALHFPLNRLPQSRGLCEADNGDSQKKDSRERPTH